MANQLKLFKEDIPEYISDYVFLGYQEYGDPGLGISLRFQKFGLNETTVGKIDAYIYNLGIDIFPTSLDSEFYEELVIKDLKEIKEYYSSVEDFVIDAVGFNSNIKILSQSGCWVGKFEFKKNDSQNEKRTYYSFYLLTMYQNNLFKLRITADEDEVKGNKIDTLTELMLFCFKFAINNSSSYKADS